MRNWDTYYFPQEVMEQAEVIRNCMTNLEGVCQKLAEKYRNISRVYIVGSGDCYFISLAAAEAFRTLAQIEAYGYEAYDYYLEKPKTDEQTMVILFSSSGKSLYVLKSLEYVKSAGGIALGVTNHKDSPLGQESSEVLITDSVGVSKTFPTKTTTSALALMYQMAYHLAEQKGTIDGECFVQLEKELRETVPSVIDRIYKEETELLKKCVPSFLEARCYTYVGSGPCRSTAMVGAAKIVETSRGHVTFCNAEEYMHLHGFSIKSSDAVIIIGNNISDHREIQAAEYASDQRARVLVVGNVNCDLKTENCIHVAPYLKELSEWGNSICTMVVLQLFACELSRLSFKDPDAPHDVNLKKVIDLLYTGPVAGWNSPSV